MEIFFSSTESIWNKKELWQRAKYIEHSVTVTPCALPYALCFFNITVLKFSTDNLIGLVFNKVEK